MAKRQHLLIIDPQNDFCDLPQPWWGWDPLADQAVAPALPVVGAHADMLRLAHWVDQGRSGLTDITVTLDSHHSLDIAHPTFWAQADGSAVAPFTLITAQALRSGRFQPKDALAYERALAYLCALEAQGRYQLMVWPVHCAIGSWGHNVHAAVRAAYQQWEQQRQRVVQFVFKGSNPWTEHYSAIQAEVPDTQDPHTLLNLNLIANLDQADTVFIAGEASSHCVRATTEHLVQHLPSGRTDKLVLLTDCMSAVAGFEPQARDFLRQMQERGVRLASSEQLVLS